MCKIDKNDGIYSVTEEKLCLFPSENNYSILLNSDYSIPLNEEVCPLLLGALKLSRLNGLYNFILINVELQTNEKESIRLIEIQEKGKGVLMELQTKNLFVKGTLYDRFAIEDVHRNLFFMEREISLSVNNHEPICLSKDKEIQIVSDEEKKTIELLGDNLIKTNFAGKYKLEVLDANSNYDFSDKVIFSYFSETGINVDIYNDDVFHRCNLTVDNNSEDCFYIYEMISDYLLRLATTTFCPCLL